MRKSLFVVGSLALGYAACTSTPAATTSAGDPFAIGRGSYLVNAVVDCGGCHTADPTKPFAGGVKFPIDNAGHFVTSRNLTKDPATGLKLTQDQFITAMRTGADFTNQGQLLVVMPWPNFRWMTDDDLKAIYAFLQVLPASSNAIEPDNKGPASLATPVPFPTQYNEGEETRPLPAAVVDPLGPPNAKPPADPNNELLGAALLPLSYAKMPNFGKRSPEEQRAFGRGSYLVTIAACGECHTNKGGAPRILTPGPDFLRIPADSYLTGGTTYSVPAPLNPLLKQTRTMSANLIGKSGYFNEPTTTYLGFASEMEALAHTDENPPKPMGWPMPAGHIRQLTDDDRLAVYTYMKILAEDYDHTGQVDKATQSQARYCTANTDCSAGETCFVDGSAQKVVNNQCVGRACMVDADCDVCQKCTNKACVQPSASDACLSTGL